MRKYLFVFVNRVTAGFA